MFFKYPCLLLIMHLVITIPAYNEEKSIGSVIDSIPSKISGISQITVLVLDDGSTDSTSSVARKHGALVIRNKTNKGLAFTFKRVVDEALALGADIIQNTDADNQYNQFQIQDTIRPILEGKADFVLGSRFKGKIEYMPFGNYYGNILATKAVRIISGLDVSDGQSGFRAMTREAALKLNIQSSYTYTQESLLQVAEKKISYYEVPIDFKKRSGKSRLMSSIFHYAKRSFLTLLQGSLSYKPLSIFLPLSGLFFLSGFAFGYRVLEHFFLTGQVSPYIPSALLASVLLIFSFLSLIVGLLGESLKEHRRASEEILYYSRKQAFSKTKNS